MLLGAFIPLYDNDIVLQSIFGFERKLSGVAVPIDIHQKAVMFLLWVMCKSQALYMLK